MRLNMDELLNNKVTTLEHRSRAILSRGPGRVVTQELAKVLSVMPEGEQTLELDYGSYVLRIELLPNE